MPIIKNFGFMWERDKVAWGKRGPGGSASFDGIRTGNKKKRVSFLEQMGIYVPYDKFEQPVQIGQSTVIFKRLQQHRSDHLRNRWSLFSWFGFYSAGAKNQLLVKAKVKRVLSLRDGLDEIEAVLIQVLEPRLNRKGPNWQVTEEYLQASAVSEDETDPDEEEPDEEESDFGLGPKFKPTHRRPPLV